ncbi:hypothetical protein MMA231_02033 [Asticcacaulis sp. MM231]|uniref:DUF1697 domain-containing protein n=1 Tax=Asticcacaulis sp. MM231 TaxID=3157666 RepID=UPI0032D59FB9
MSKVWIGLFRGINVGGNNKLPMKDLTRLMLAAGLSDVKTYIASGNVLFRSDLDDAALEALIGDLVETNFGFRPSVFLITLSHLEKVLAENPFRDHAHKGKAQHVFFFKAPPSKIDRDLLDSLKDDSEAYEISDELMYLYAPEGIGRSKMAEKIGRAIKADMTARNLNTVETLQDMAMELS